MAFGSVETTANRSLVQGYRAGRYDAAGSWRARGRYRVSPHIIIIKTGVLWIVGVRERMGSRTAGDEYWDWSM